MKISKHTFIGDHGLNFFQIINEIRPEKEIIIGGDRDSSIPETDFDNIKKELPTKHGYQQYMKAKIEAAFSNYFDIQKDYITNYQKYLDKKSQSKSKFQFLDEIKDFEIHKYEFLHEKLRNMLENFENYVEDNWQKEINHIILILFPQYIGVLNKVITRSPSGQRKEIDLALVKGDGTIDIIEIKQPFINAVLARKKYRDNFYPNKELGGSVIQAEKYIYYLKKSGKNGEDLIFKKYQDYLQKLGIKSIKIINPKALIILGRDNDFGEDQQEDFEIIKRHYSNIADIITYDDLLKRLECLILAFKTSGSSS